MKEKTFTNTNTEKVIPFLKCLNINTLLQNRKKKILTLYKVLFSVIKSKSDKRKKAETLKYPVFLRVQKQHRYKHLWKHFSYLSFQKIKLSLTS